MWLALRQDTSVSVITSYSIHYTKLYETPKYLAATQATCAKLSYDDTIKALGSPLFVKPANLGSSVGVSKVEDKQQFAAAVRDALQYDNKIMIEQCIGGREIECSVLGNEDPIASLPGEIKPTHAFYSYDAKYIDAHGADRITSYNVCYTKLLRGLMPKRSREQNSVPDRASAIANAHMPMKRSTQRGPHARYASRRTSVSEVEWKETPSRASSRASSR